MLRISLPTAWLDEIQPTLQDLVTDKVASRISQKDFTLWGEPAESESRIRLGWVDAASNSLSLISDLAELKDTFSAAGINRIVLCGMGGSSLAPEVISKKYGVQIEILDSTSPEQLNEVISQGVQHTAVVVSSKSGSTVETDSQKRLFEDLFAKAGISRTERIIIVTDPGSPLDQAARQDGYRVFNADPNVGGRYSALTAFGVVPSYLAGVPVEELLNQALSTKYLAEDSSENPALILGALLAALPGLNGPRDKVGILADQITLPGFADWAEQLIAESTGKDEKGILPIALTEQSP
ncbi:MAG: glucose-6-phosphate isomerase, partial [Rhodoluna sp.]